MNRNALLVTFCKDRPIKRGYHPYVAPVRCSRTTEREMRFFKKSYMTNVKLTPLTQPTHPAIEN